MNYSTSCSSYKNISTSATHEREEIKLFCVYLVIKIALKWIDFQEVKKKNYF
jgi:hypothetical protein